MGKDGGRGGAIIDLLPYVVVDQPAGHVLVVRAFLGYEISRCLDQGFLYFLGPDAGVKLQLRSDFHLAGGNPAQPLGCPHDLPVDLLDVKWFLSPVAFHDAYLSMLHGGHGILSFKSVFLLKLGEP